MSVLDDIALSDPALEVWMARKKTPPPLVDSLSGVEGYVTAVAVGPRFPDPQYWLCPLMGLTEGDLDAGDVAATFAKVSDATIP